MKSFEFARFDATCVKRRSVEETGDYGSLRRVAAIAALPGRSVDHTAWLREEARRWTLPDARHERSEWSESRGYFSVLY